MTRERRHDYLVRLLRAQRCRCAYCRAPLSLATATLDHVVPRALGGRDYYPNLRAACGPCNAKKGCKAPHLWLNELAQGLVA